MFSNSAKVDYLSLQSMDFDDNVCRAIAQVVAAVNWLDEIDDYVWELADSFPRTFRYLRCCHNSPPNHIIGLYMINEIMESIGRSYGVEGFIFSCDYGRDLGFSYVNTGDSYNSTIAYCPIDHNFIVTSCGDYQEAIDQNGGEEIE